MSFGLFCGNSGCRLAMTLTERPCIRILIRRGGHNGYWDISWHHFSLLSAGKMSGWKLISVRFSLQHSLFLCSLNSHNL
ncbi:hypothetical protein Hsero_2355 [Herbaspirillum seropedicae SmR1]|uniref:Uncharacterized protein n=1 Tax=Herbaspirillum seropedicae (strain SmR1) TaxID=757424 RepID=D8IVB5_HERSS|nr:hypothetical protein Hsero_2355 [Herbaspirillum seropedicae SmR1]